MPYRPNDASLFPTISPTTRSAFTNHRHETPVRPTRVLIFHRCLRTGIEGGRFLERQRVKKANQPRYPVEVSEYLARTDFYVGARIIINGFDFDIYDADEYAFKVMEKESHLFPVSNQRLILGKVRSFFASNADAQPQFQQHDPQRKGYFGYETFFGLMKNLLGHLLTDHEIITLARFYAQKLLKEHDIYSVVAVAQEHLRKHNYEHLAPLKENLISRDRK